GSGRQRDAGSRGHQRHRPGGRRCALRHLGLGLRSDSSSPHRGRRRCHRPRLLPTSEGERVTDWYMLLAAVLFVIGAMGILIRRNALVMFMCVELMLNAVNLTL